MAVNGKVYVPTNSSTLVVYGLLPATSVNPSADSYVRGGAYANDNYGSIDLLEVGDGTQASDALAKRCTYISFDLTHDTVTPTSATLELHVLPGSTPTDAHASVSVFGLTDPWSETGITWNTAPDLNTALGSSTATPIAGRTISTKPGVVTFDVTSFVQSSLGQVVTLQLIDTSDDGACLHIAGREEASLSPQLLLK
jgi:hypothetical protein